MLSLPELLAAAGSHLAIAVLVIHLIVRQLRSDAALPINVPARFRPLAAVVLSVVAAAVEKVVSGVALKEAALFAAYAAAGAVLLHVFGVNVLLGGTEIAPAIGRPGPPSGPSLMGGAMLALAASAALLLVMLLTGCGLLTSKNAKTALDVTKIACVVEHAVLDDAALNRVCDGIDTADPEVRKFVDGARMGAAHGASRCADAGAQ